jgi:hypothetical protein
MHQIDGAPLNARSQAAWGRQPSAAAFAIRRLNELLDRARPGEERQCAIGKFTGELQDVYRYRGIDTDAIVHAALNVIAANSAG